MIKGYITLKRAAEVSGKEIEALKKQCQAGRIRGAIKQGNTWFVPQSEILVDDTSVGNGTLNYLISFVESSVGNHVGVTLLVNGTFIQGELISKKEYLQHFRSEMLKGLETSTPQNQDSLPLLDFTNQYFDELEQKDEDGIPSFVHLKKISSANFGDGSPSKGSYLRVRSSTVDGFMLGTTRGYGE